MPSRAESAAPARHYLPEPAGSACRRRQDLTPSPIDQTENNTNYINGLWFINAMAWDLRIGPPETSRSDGDQDELVGRSLDDRPDYFSRAER